MRRQTTLSQFRDEKILLDGLLVKLKKYLSWKWIQKLLKTPFPCELKQRVQYRVTPRVYKSKQRASSALLFSPWIFRNTNMDTSTDGIFHFETSAFKAQHYSKRFCFVFEKRHYQIGYKIKWNATLLCVFVLPFFKLRVRPHFIGNFYSLKQRHLKLTFF